MSKSQNSFIKKEKEKKRLQKKKAKQERKKERQESKSDDTSLENMMAYVDEYGNIIDSPPENSGEEVDASDIEIGIPKKEKEDIDASRRGRVVFYDEKKGYGFINQDGSQERYFVHSSNITSPIQEGDKVSFVAQRGAKGMDAIQVKVL